MYDGRGLGRIMIRRKFITMASAAATYSSSWLCEIFPSLCGCDADPSEVTRGEVGYSPSNKTITKQFEVPADKLGCKGDTVGYSVTVKGNGSKELLDEETGEIEIR